MLTIAALVLSIAATPPQPRVDAGAAKQFEYDRTAALDVRETGRREENGVLLRDITYATLTGGRNAATLATSKTPLDRPAPGILFVHWYGPPAPTSNRTQFIPDAIVLARQGVTSLLIDTPWSVPEYFRSRTRAEDYPRSLQQVRDLRRALDVLFAEARLDRARIAYVGHDFGAMYGTLAAASDPRITRFVFMAGTESFSDWFLYGPKMEDAARRQFIQQLAPLDPVRWVSKLHVPVLMQFADNDEHVSAERRQRLIAAAPKGTDVRLYKAGHELNEQATRERIEWLRRAFTLSARPEDRALHRH